VTDRAEDGVDGIANSTLEVTAAEVTIGFHMADHGFDGGAASELAFDGTKHAALLPRDEDAVWI